MNLTLTLKVASQCCPITLQLMMMQRRTKFGYKWLSSSISWNYLLDKPRQTDRQLMDTVIPAYPLCYRGYKDLQCDSRCPQGSR